MSEINGQAPYRVAVIVDGEVIDSIMCDEHSWAMFTSNPIFVDITNDPTSLVIGQKYNV